MGQNNSAITYPTISISPNNTDTSSSISPLSKSPPITFSPNNIHKRLKLSGVDVYKPSGNTDDLSLFLTLPFSRCLSVVQLKSLISYTEIRFIKPGYDVFNQFYCDDNSYNNTLFEPGSYIYILNNNGGIDIFINDIYLCTCKQGHSIQTSIPNTNNNKPGFNLSVQNKDNNTNYNYPLQDGTNASGVSTLIFPNPHLNTLNNPHDPNNISPPNPAQVIAPTNRKDSKENNNNITHPKLVSRANNSLCVLYISYKNLCSYISSNVNLFISCGLDEYFFSPILTLAKLKLFQGIEYNKLCILLYLMRLISLDSGDIVFEEGSNGTQLYIVIKGQLEAFVINNNVNNNNTTNNNNSNPTNKIQSLHIFNSSDVFGELALLLSIPRTASVRATRPSLIFELPRASYDKFINLLPPTVSMHNIMKERIAEHFRKYHVPFFEAIPQDKYTILANLCKIEQYQPNQVIFRQGDIATAFYIIAHGEVKITANKFNQHKNTTEEITLCAMKAGKYFGEIALVQDSLRTAAVTTISRCVLLSITRDNFREFFLHAPEAIADFEVKLARYDVQLRSVLYHHIGLEYFTLHLQREYSSENIEFWKQCRDFRHATIETVKELNKKKIHHHILNNNNMKINYFHYKVELYKLIQGNHFQQINFNNNKTNNTNNSSNNSNDLLIQARTELFSALSIFSDRAMIDNNNLNCNSCITIEQFHELMLLFGIDNELATINICEQIQFQIIQTINNHHTSNHIHNNNNNNNATNTNIDHNDLVNYILKVIEFVKQQAANENIKTTTTNNNNSNSNNDDDDKSNDNGNNINDSILIDNNTYNALMCNYTICELYDCIITSRVSAFRSAFETFDLDHSGSLEYNEFIHVLKSIGSMNDILSLQKAKSEFDLLDTNKTGHIKFDRFLSFYLQHNRDKKMFKEYLLNKAQEICTRYISDTAEKQVNIEGPTQKEIENEVKRVIDNPNETLPLNLFDRAEEQILKLMSADPFNRFKQSPAFQEFLEKANSYKHLSANNNNNNDSKDGNNIGPNSPSSGAPVPLQRQNSTGTLNNAASPTNAGGANDNDIFDERGLARFTRVRSHSLGRDRRESAAAIINSTTATALDSVIAKHHRKLSNAANLTVSPVNNGTASTDNNNNNNNNTSTNSTS